MNELTLTDARRKYDFSDLQREDYTRVREVPPDTQGEGALFIYHPAKGDYVTVDMYLTKNGRAICGVPGLDCHVSHADRVVDAIASSDLDKMNALLSDSTLYPASK